MRGRSRYFILGAAVGAAAALAFAPKKGSEFRKIAVEGAKKLIESSDEILRDIKERLEDIAEEVEIVPPDEEIVISVDYESEDDEYER
ncbi:YtxH-like protein [Peptoclostridium litorale DSM 5388]|uniref:YtxH domain-containing protein n=1 Tax=Peptoclostridium litorale DSM 5388 TaxID=1121324 RepID=A0A069RH67_PEPLI|nr:YtxH domain-containing protein [Peptoclostridium litorale]KDR96389.1 hypothetical protein CLIT_4c02270 [Peptoclostridium litorale DSM 5388]SIO27416.1 YtxH-like protein [Peptoclostridium litorale DSM 5388]